MKIVIVGTGYVGLITGISLANFGHIVCCIEQDKNKVSIIQNGKPPFYEADAEKYLKKLIKKKLLYASDNLEKNAGNADIIFIAVGTPTIKNKIDLSAIKKAAAQIGKTMKNSSKYQVVAVKSTVLPGVTEKIIKPILEKYSGKKTGQFGLVMNPEFLREGNALKDALNPDRIVIGQIDEKSGRSFAKIYQKISTPIIFTNLWTAELTKYAANALFATLISYSNEIARIAENTGKVDVVDVWKGVHLDKRLSPLNGKRRIKPGILNYIFSGCGFGGSCFPKDIRALASFAKQAGIKTKVINGVIDVNDTQTERVIMLLKSALGKTLKNKASLSLRDKKIAILGLSFKPDTDDTRESPALTLVQALIAEKALLVSHDPKARLPKILGGVVKTVKTAKEAVKNADAVVIITAWNEYVNLTPKFFKENMKYPVVIDGRRIYPKELFIKEGVEYRGIGYNPQ